MIFCKNCKFPYCERIAGDKDDKYWCKKGVADFFSKDGLMFECKIKNAENDCPDYKRKWWKFWIK